MRFGTTTVYMSSRKTRQHWHLNQNQSPKFKQTNRAAVILPDIQESWPSYKWTMQKTTLVLPKMRYNQPTGIRPKLRCSHPLLGFEERHPLTWLSVATCAMRELRREFSWMNSWLRCLERQRKLEYGQIDQRVNSGINMWDMSVVQPLSEKHAKTIVWNFSTTSHGKGPVDRVEAV